MYPAFQGIGADDFLRCATDFQRHLFNKIPLKNDKRYVIVRLGVWLLRPGTRSHVNHHGDWHIDGGSDYDHLHPEQRVFILSSPCSALTEFNLNPLEVESSPNETLTDFYKRISTAPEEFGVIGQAIEPCRIYTFANHLHRAVDPKRMEFRFYLRVRETDAPDISTTKPLRTVSLRDAGTGVERRHIEYSQDKVSIYYPIPAQ